MESQQFDLAIIALPFAYPDEGLIASGDYCGVCILPKLHAQRKKKLSGFQTLPMSISSVCRMER